MNTKHEYSVTIEGLDGRVINGSYGPELHGKWASHTGYRSLASGPDTMRLSEHEAMQLAHRSYTKHAAYPFVVGEEHKAHGWKSIYLNLKGCVQIRLPNWHEGPVASVIEAMGMLYTDNLNYTWSFPGGVSLADARVALAPLLKRVTRFMDKQLLVKALRLSGAVAGFLYQQEQLGFAF